MAESFPFRLVTPIGIVIDEPVEQITAQNPLGEFAVLAHHIDFITSLVPGILAIKMPERAAFYVLTGGIAEVKDGAMTILADEAQLPERLDRAAIVGEVEVATELYARLSSFDPQYADAARALALAIARQRAAELARPQ